MRKRGLLSVFFLSLLTCGIYSIYWQVVTFSEVMSENNENAFPMIINVLLVIVTCGIWSIYLQYKIADTMFVLEQKNNMVTENLNIIVLALAILGYSSFGILSITLLQDKINRYCIENKII